MSSLGKARQPFQYTHQINRHDNEIRQLFGLLRSRNTPQTIQTPFLGTSTPGGTGTGFLKTQGDTMIGPFAMDANTAFLSSDILSIGSSTSAYKSIIYVSPQTGFTDDLVTISGAAFNWQFLWLCGAATGNTITIKTTGNIVPLGGADFSLVDEDVVLLFFDPTDGKWRQLTAGTLNTSGANRFLSNLTSPTAINQDLLPASAGDKDLGSTLFDWNDLFVEQLRLQPGGIEVTNKPVLTNFNDAMALNVPSDKKFLFRFGGVDKFDISASQFSGNYGILSQSMILNDAGSTPTISGEFRRSGGHVYVVSGGALRNLSCIECGVVVDILMPQNLFIELNPTENNLEPDNIAIELNPSSSFLEPLLENELTVSP